MKEYVESASYEHQFWLNVLSAHASIIHNALSPKEKDAISKAHGFTNTFNTLLEKAPNLSNNNVIAFTKEAETAAEKLKDFKLSIIKRSLTGDIGIHLSPTCLNHMVNALEEYVLVMSYLKEGKAAPTFHELHHHLIWLAAAANQAKTIHYALDGMETRIQEKSLGFAERFNQFYVKAIELTGFLRTNLTNFPSLMKFNEDVQVDMTLFRTFLQELKEMARTNMVLGRLSPEMLDLFDQKASYFLQKLKESANRS